MGLEAPVRRTIHTSGGKGTVHAQLSLASLDVVSDLLQIVKALDVVLGIASGGQQFLVVDDAVGLDNVGDSGNGVAILQCEGIAGQLTVQLAAGQVVAVILPVGQTTGPLTWNRVGASLFSISLIRVVSYWPEAAVTTVTGTPVSSV